MAMKFHPFFCLAINRRVCILFSVLFLLAFCWFNPAPAEAGRPAQIVNLRHWTNPTYTRVVLDLSRTADYKYNELPGNAAKGISPRIYVDIPDSTRDLDLASVIEIEDGLLRRVRFGTPNPGRTRMVVDLVTSADFKVFHLEDPYRIVIDIGGNQKPVLSARSPEIRNSPPARSSDALAEVLERSAALEAQERSLPAGNEHSGLRRIVVDAGHGGKDPGAVGPNGVLEKDIALAMAKLLKRQLEKDIGCEVILTRDRDVFLPLEERTAIANKVGADLFISLHANASTHRSAYGTETYYLNLSKNDQAAAVAARENGTTLKEVGDLEAILFDLMANAKINESGRLAAEIQKSMVSRLSRKYSNIRDLGVRQGPFYVLLGATMPSVLVEAAFISNHREEARLVTRDFQQNTALAISQAVRNYGVALELLAQR